MTCCADCTIRLDDWSCDLNSTLRKRQNFQAPPLTIPSTCSFRDLLPSGLDGATTESQPALGF